MWIDIQYNIRLWGKGIAMILLFPLVVAWIVIVDFPIQIAKEFDFKL